MFISYKTGYERNHTTTVVERRDCCEEMGRCWQEKRTRAWDAAAISLEMPSTGGINERVVFLDAAGQEHDEILPVSISYCPWCGEKIELKFVGRE